MAEALAEVKRTFGPDAVIIRTRCVRAGGALGVGGRDVYEITAAGSGEHAAPAPMTADERMTRASAAMASTDDDFSPFSVATFPEPRRSKPQTGAGVPEELLPKKRVAVAPPPPTTDRAAPPPSKREAPKPEAPRPEPQKQAAPKKAPRALTPPTTSDDDRAAEIERELASLRGMVEEIMKQTKGASSTTAAPREGVPNSRRPVAVPESVERLGRRLAEQQTPPATIEELQRAIASELTPSECADDDLVRATAARLIAERIPTSDGKIDTGPDPRVIALIGPTGVGKTTTIAKLAALLKLRHGRRVALITTDTYRIAAAEQLRVYADIIGLPLRVTTRPEEAARAREELGRTHDVVIVDTPGRSQRDARRIDELANILAAVQPDERRLVCSAATGGEAISRVNDAYAAAWPDGLILSKLDEAPGAGVILDAVERTKLPIAYITTGQEVPDDIEGATSASLAGLILDGFETSRRR